jgi:hypothetical protein
VDWASARQPVASFYLDVNLLNSAVAALCELCKVQLN